MELLTSRFGGISFQADDIIVFPSGTFGFPHDRQWLLAADGHDPHLYWLQAISNSDAAIPLWSADGLSGPYKISIARAQVASLGLASGGRPAALLPVLDMGTGLAVGLHLPILIGGDSRLGLQCHNKRYQPLQWLASEPPAPLRQCA